jgi:hypothetical protein
MGEQTLPQIDAPVIPTEVEAATQLPNPGAKKV